MTLKEKSPLLWDSRLDRNQITSSIPSNISNLVNLEELNLSNNKINGAIPDLSALTGLQYIDLSNNSFNSVTVPSWLANMEKLTTIAMDNCSLTGQISSAIFDLPALERLQMKNNQLNGTVKIDISDLNKVQWVDLRNNSITQADVQGNTSLWIAGNPVCISGSSLSSSESCQNMEQEKSYETVMRQCGEKNCSGELKSNPKTCMCQQPYEGELIFRAPSFSDLTDIQRFKDLEDHLKSKLGLEAIYLCCIYFDSTKYLIVPVKFFPADSRLFTWSEVTQISFNLSNQIHIGPDEFGSLLFNATPYHIRSEESSTRLGLAIIAGIAVGAVVLVLAGIVIGIYAPRHKKKAEKAIEMYKPFASWGARSMHDANTPKLKGARWFSFAEIKAATNNFSESNGIGSGGYGKVYKGMLPEGEMVAIKRAQQGSLQCGTEFKNEIELLSRVHHKNLVGLIGFCTEQEEQMLVYEYIPNGTLRQNLIGEFKLDWPIRLQIALDSAKGLNYLHELANPPIIHRDVKSSNILLDENLNAKVADFGLSKLVPDGVDAGDKSPISSQVKGTLGYLDPEYYMTQQLSEKSDVYSFGIVLLELITARPPIEGRKHIVRLVEEALESGGIACLREEVMYPDLRHENLTGLGEFLGLALSCLKKLGAERPTMRDAVKKLESIVEIQGPSHSIHHSPQRSPTDVKAISKFCSDNEECISMVLAGQGEESCASLEMTRLTNCSSAS